MAGISSGIEIRSAWFSKKNGSRYKYALRDLTQLEYFGVPGDTEKPLWNAWFFPAADAATEAATETIAVSKRNLPLLFNSRLSKLPIA